MTKEELEEEIKDLIDDYLTDNNENVDLAVNMQSGNKWITVKFELEIDTLYDKTKVH